MHRPPAEDLPPLIANGGPAWAIASSDAQEAGAIYDAGDDSDEAEHDS